MRSLSLILLATSPAFAAEEPKDDSPLQVGTKWAYQISNREDKFIVAVVGEEKVGARTCKKLESQLGDKVVGVEYIAFEKDGYYRTRLNTEELAPAVCFRKLDAKKGDTWKVEFKIGETKVTAAYEVDFEDVTVPAGIFKNALVVKTVVTEGENTTKTTTWFAPGRWMVKQVFDLGEKKVTFDLVAIEVPKK